MMIFAVIIIIIIIIKITIKYFDNTDYCAYRNNKYFYNKNFLDSPFDED